MYFIFSLPALLVFVEALFSCFVRCWLIGERIVLHTLPPPPSPPRSLPRPPFSKTLAGHCAASGTVGRGVLPPRGKRYPGLPHLGFQGRPHRVRQPHPEEYEDQVSRCFRACQAVWPVLLLLRCRASLVVEPLVSARPVTRCCKSSRLVWAVLCKDFEFSLVPLVLFCSRGIFVARTECMPAGSAAV